MTSTPINRGSVAKATAWTLIDFVLERGANFIIIVLLARLLTPAEFGLVALLSLFVALAVLLCESGFGQALIQREEITEEDRSTTFWINIGISALAGALLALAAPWIAAFFDQPLLMPLLLVLIISVGASALGAVQRALLLRALQYRRLMFIRLSATVTAGILAVWLALNDYGVFALAWQASTLAVATTILLWITSEWRPRFVFDPIAAKRLFSFGGFMLASSVLETIYSRAYTLFIGKIESPSILGQFGRAESTLALVQGLVTFPLNQIAFPALSRVGSDKNRMASGMRAALRASMAINVPAMLGLVAVAEPFMLAAYGDQWRPAVPFLQILCLGGVLMPIHIVNLQGLMAAGRSDLFFKLEVAKKLVGGAILITGSFWGAIGIAWAIVFAGLLGAVINTSFSARSFGYGLQSQLVDIAPSILLGAVVSVSAYLVLNTGFFEPDQYFAQLIFAAAIGAVVWALLVLIFNVAELGTMSKEAMSAVRQNKRGHIES